MSVKKGTFVCKSDPFVYCVATECLETNCDFCLNKSGELRKCIGCSFVRYCDKSCQKKAWKVHKHECSNIKRVLRENKIPNDALLMMSRIIYKLKLGNGGNKVETVGEVARRFSDLKSHSEDIRNDAKRFEDVLKMEKLLQEFLPAEDMPPLADVLDIFGKSQINGDKILDDDYETIGTAVYLGVSIFDHSCRPNATISFDGIAACVYLIEDLPSLDLTKIFVSYTELRATKEERQKDLKENYYFDCDCVRCLDVDDDKILTSFKCEILNCDAPVISKDDAWSCTQCNNSLDKTRTDAALESMEHCVNFWPKLEKLLELNHMEVVLSTCDELLDSASTLLHPLNVHYHRICEMAYFACVSLNSVESAFALGKNLIPLTRKCNGKFYSPLGVMMLRMGKAANVLGQHKNAKKYLNEAFEIFGVTRGLSEEALAPYRVMLSELQSRRRGR